MDQPAAGSPSRPLSGARVAIVHDWLVTLGGAELVLGELLRVFPDAELFTLIDHMAPEDRAAIGAGAVLDSAAAAGTAAAAIREGAVHTSIFQSVPGIERHYRSFLPLMPAAMRSLDVSGYDLVLSNSHAVAKGVRTHAGQLHLCYCLSPMRYAWDLREQYLREAGLDGPVAGPLARSMLEGMRRWDESNSRRVGAFATLSHYIADRIRRAYGRDAQVVYPPVDTDFFTPGGVREDFYVTASRFVPYKRVDMIAKAFALLPDRRLVIIGDGPDAAKVRAAAGPNVTLVGRASREVLRDHFRRARAFLFAAEEDFGIAPVEAQACGTPVIAFGRGGVCETVRGARMAPESDGPRQVGEPQAPTGLFYAGQSAGALAAAIRQFESLPAAIPLERCRENALRFAAAEFRRGIRTFVEDEWARWSARSR